MSLVSTDGGDEPALAGDSEFLDQVFRVLSAPERRSIIRLLQAADGPMATVDLAHEIVEQDEGAPREGDSADDVAAIETSLHHAHLPALRSANVVNLDADRRSVSPGECFGTVASLLESVDEAFPPD